MELKQVLVVDDSEADQFLNRYRLLECQPDIQVRAVYDGLEALEVLRTPGYKPDLILLDINMPRMNGFEFLEAYTQEFSEQICVLMLSSSLVDSDRSRAESFAAVRGFLRKPLNVSWPKLLSEMLSA